MNRLTLWYPDPSRDIGPDHNQDTDPNIRKVTGTGSTLRDTYILGFKV
jgi:hypothetical protein